MERSRMQRIPRRSRLLGDLPKTIALRNFLHQLWMTLDAFCRALAFPVPGSSAADGSLGIALLRLAIASFMDDDGSVDFSAPDAGEKVGKMANQVALLLLRTIQGEARHLGAIKKAVASSGPKGELAALVRDETVFLRELYEQLSEWGVRAPAEKRPPCPLLANLGTLAPMASRVHSSASASRRRPSRPSR